MITSKFSSSLTSLTVLTKTYYHPDFWRYKHQKNSILQDWAIYSEIYCWQTSTPCHYKKNLQLQLNKGKIGVKVENLFYENKTKKLFCYNLSYPHIRFWIFWILKNVGPLLAKFLALTFSEGSKNLAYSFKCYFWAYMWI